MPPATAASSSCSSRPTEDGTPRASATPRPTPPASRSSTTGPTSDEVRQAGNIPYAPFARNAAFFEKYHRQDAGHQRGGRADELAHRGDCAQLERAELRGVSDHDGAARRALCAGPSRAIPELRGVLRDRRSHPLHPHRQREPAARHRRPGVADVQRDGLGGAGVVSGGDRGADRGGAQPVAGATCATARSTARRSPPRG